MERIDEDCMVVSRGSNLILFNFSSNALPIVLPNTHPHKVLFNETEEEVILEGEKLVLGPLNCVMLESQE